MNTTAASPAVAPPRARLRSDPLLVTLLLWLVAFGMQAAAYRSLQAPVVGVAFFLAGLLPLAALWPRDRSVFTMYTRMFAVGWFVAGLAALYLEVLGDPLQSESDAASFFQLASGTTEGLDLAQLGELTEGAGAVLLWRALYDAFDWLGLDKQRYLGIDFNVLLVASTGVVALLMARRLYGRDVYRESRLILLFSLCALMWLFSAVHLRDSVVLLSITLTVHAWVCYATSSSALRVPGLAAAMLAATVALAALRTEFVFVPLLVTLAGVASLVLTRSGHDRRARRRRALALLLLAGAGLVGWVYIGNLVDSVTAGAETYRGLVEDEAARESLGARLIVHQPLPIRIVVGSVYLFIFPIPIWSGFVADSVVPLLKTANALFFYALVPLLVIAVRELLGLRGTNRALLLFMLILAAAFTGAIAVTSLEVRHFGAFLVPMFMLALLPDLRAPALWRRYRRGLTAMLGAMALLHLAWFALKTIV